MQSSTLLTRSACGPRSRSRDAHRLYGSGNKKFDMLTFVLGIVGGVLVGMVLGAILWPIIHNHMKKGAEAAPPT